MVDVVDAARSWRDAGIPARHAQAMNLRTTTTGPWMDTYRRLRDQIARGFLIALLGKRGTGKTQMAICLLRDAADAGRTVRYVKAMDLFRELRASFRPDGPDEIRLLERYTRYGMLVIDEAHERGNSEWEDRALVNLIDRRYDRMVDTILIGNQTPETFAEAIGPSIVSRTHECGECIVCDWGSYRQSRTARLDSNRAVVHT